jgi:hypothetical protein
MITLDNNKYLKLPDENDVQLNSDLAS